MRHAVLACCLALTLSLQTGCLSLTSFLQPKAPSLDTRLLEAQGYSIPPGGMPTSVKSDSSVPSIVLEVRTTDGKRHVERIPVPMEGVFIEDIVRQAQLHNKVGSLQISIMRPTADQNPPVRLDLHTDNDGKVKNTATNYALFPGDHVIVNENNKSALEKFFLEQFTNG